MVDTDIMKFGQCTGCHFSWHLMGKRETGCITATTDPLHDDTIRLQPDLSFEEINPIRVLTTALEQDVTDSRFLDGQLLTQALTARLRQQMQWDQTPDLQIQLSCGTHLIHTHPLTLEFHADGILLQTS